MTGNIGFQTLSFCHLQPKAGDPVGWFLDSRASARMTGEYWLSDLALSSSSAEGWRSSRLISGFTRKRENDGEYWLSDLDLLSSSAEGWRSSRLVSGFPRKRENDGEY